MPLCRAEKGGDAAASLTDIMPAGCGKAADGDIGSAVGLDLSVSVHFCRYNAGRMNFLFLREISLSAQLEFMYRYFQLFSVAVQLSCRFGGFLCRLRICLYDISDLIHALCNLF